MDRQVWDLHFMREAKLWSSMSKCLSRQIGAVLVKENRVIATGYNGPPSKVMHCDYRDDSGKYRDESKVHWYRPESLIRSIPECPRQRMGYKSGEGLEHCPAVHAEINPILQCAKFGIPMDGATLYCYCNIPCIACAKEIINSGIKRVVCLGTEEYQNGIKSMDLFNMANVKVDTIDEHMLIEKERL